MEIYVGNIPPTIKISELCYLYQSFGPIVFIDIKNRCEPPFAFILFNNEGSAYNAAISTNGYMYQGYQFQVKLLTPHDNSPAAGGDKILEKETDKPPGENSEKIKTVNLPKNINIPENGKPGGLDDPFRIGMSGAGIKWYLRYLEKGFDPKEARIKAYMHKFIALGDEKKIARIKAEKHCRILNFTNKINNSKKGGVSKKPTVSPNLVSVV